MTSDDLYLYASLAVIRFVHQSVRAGTWACFLFLLLLSAGCGGKPTLRVEDIRTVTFHASGRSWDASGAEIAALVAAYQRAERRHDDLGTTPPVGADVVLKSGEMMRFWGGSEGIQGLWYRGRAVDLRGQDLGDFLGQIAARAEQR